MSVIIVQVGQCGNQLGESVWKQLSDSTSVTTVTPVQHGGARAGPRGVATRQNEPLPPTQAPLRYGPLFASDGFARCLLVDAEPKVVNSIQSRNPTTFRRENCVTGQSGRGNCWALGYCSFDLEEFNVRQSETRSPPRNGKASKIRPAFVLSDKVQDEDDQLLLAKTLRTLHEETLRCEDGGLEAIIVMHSLAGGTGSGFGSALLENIRWYFVQDDRYGDAPDAKSRRKPPSIVPEEQWLSGAYGKARKAQYTVSICVAPRLQGETTVQSFNATLSLRTIIPAVDAVVLLRNDVPGLAPEAWSMNLVNLHFADAVTTLLQGGLVFGAVGELIVKACPMRSHNVLTVLPLTKIVTSTAKRGGPTDQPTRDAAASVAPHLFGFHKSAATVVLYHSPSSPAPPALRPEHFLHDSLVASASVLVSTVDLTTVMHPNASRRAPSCSSVLVLAQGAELARTLIFPLLADCHRKVEAKAFLHNYAGMGKLAPLLFPMCTTLRYAEDDVSRVGYALSEAIGEVARIFVQYPGT